jgi:hypothetical protein
VSLRKNLNLSATGTGGDGVYEDLNGEYVAYEVKFRSTRRVPCVQTRKLSYLRSV